MGTQQREPEPRIHNRLVTRTLRLRAYLDGGRLAPTPPAPVASLTRVRGKEENLSGGRFPVNPAHD
jgi:hypothetical protein